MSFALDMRSSRNSRLSAPLWTGMSNVGEKKKRYINDTKATGKQGRSGSRSREKKAVPRIGTRSKNLCLPPVVWMPLPPPTVPYVCTSSVPSDTLPSKRGSRAFVHPHTPPIRVCHLNCFGVVHSQNARVCNSAASSVRGRIMGPFGVAVPHRV